MQSTFPRFLSLLSTTVIFDISQMPICLCPHIPHIPKSFGSHLFCVNIRAAHSHMHPQPSTGITVWTFLRAGKLYITYRRGPSTNVSYFHYRSGLVSCCFADSTCHQPVMAASELAAMRNLSTCELDKRRHLVTDLRTSKPYLHH